MMPPTTIPLRTLFSPREPMHPVVASMVILSASLLIIELVALPISSELSSVPSVQVGLSSQQSLWDYNIVVTVASSTLRIVSAMIWPGMAAASSFGIPVWWAQRSLRRKPLVTKGNSSTTTAAHAQLAWSERLLAASILAAALWELWAVLELRRHQAAARHQPEEKEEAQEGQDLFFCRTGPYALCLHPINTGLMWTAGAFAAAVPSSPLCWTASAAFVVHLVGKVMGWIQDWWERWEVLLAS